MGVSAPTGPLLGPGFGHADANPPRPPLEHQEKRHFVHAFSSSERRPAYSGRRLRFHMVFA